MIPVLMYKSARNEILSWPLEVKKDFGSVLTKLQKGESVGYPDVDSRKSKQQKNVLICF